MIIRDYSIPSSDKPIIATLLIIEHCLRECIIFSNFMLVWHLNPEIKFQDFYLIRKIPERKKFGIS